MQCLDSFCDEEPPPTPPRRHRKKKKRKHLTRKDSKYSSREDSKSSSKEDSKYSSREDSRSSSRTDSTSRAQNPSLSTAKYVAPEIRESITDSPTWFFTSFDERKGNAEIELSRPAKDSSSTTSNFEGFDRPVTYEEIGGKDKCKPSGKLLCGLACVLIVAAVALAWKLLMRDENREYFQLIRGDRLACRVAIDRI